VCSFPCGTVVSRGAPAGGQVARPHPGSRGIARSRTRPSWARV
jgi:hypothetical protein